MPGVDARCDSWSLGTIVYSLVALASCAFGFGVPSGVGFRVLGSGCLLVLTSENFLGGWQQHGYVCALLFRDVVSAKSYSVQDVEMVCLS